MKVYSKKSAAAIALFAGAALVLSGCSSTPEKAPEETAAGDTGALKIGTLLPQTGTLAHLIFGPRAAVKLAMDEINEAGGVLGQDIELVVEGNEHDASDPTIMNKSVDEIVKADPSFVLGAMGTGNSNAAMPRLTEAGILMGSPSNTGIAMSGINDLYFRTIASDIIQGRALGNLVLQDGNTTVAMLAQNNDYGIGLRDNFQETLEEAGAELVYGAKGSGEEFPEGQTTFTSEVTAALAKKPDAIAIVSYEEAKQIIPELAAQKFDLSKLYLVDGNTVPYEEFDAGLLEGAQGTTPGRASKGEFLDALVAADSTATQSTNFAPESYDAVMLVALAAQKGGGTDTETIVANLAAVSGADGGETCDTYKDCLALLDDGKDIHYEGRAGSGPLTDKNEPSSALIGIYKYDATNTPVAVGEIEG
ncbi:ABC transporter substrate-binding protein [Leucobacter sp. G161]|uniref:ABC transporter substrate-binding protein n=1 Tax=Leucobacter sp. G161 TaxID=663704 RepID=UPI00073B2284|nr:ABC transporter substrate-binding protein [Leucobacter sp. G161]KUF07120.1 ABC transporter substrate-binding protein [Leucobacter sp. G161]